MMRSELFGDAARAPAGEVVHVLRTVRRSIAQGFSLHLCRESGPDLQLSTAQPHQLAHSWDGGQLRAHSAGAICTPWSEGVRFFDLPGAFQAVTPHWGPAQQVAEDLLRRLLDPDVRFDLHEIAQQHQLRGLLSQLDRAILRAHAVAR